MKNLLVMYHSPCMDGYGAAVAFKDALDVSEWDSVQYHGTGYNQLAQVPNDFNHPVQKCTHVVFLDICPTREVLDYLLNIKNMYVCVLDHHATAKDTLKGYERSGLFYTITDKFSGASLVKSIPPHAINSLFKFDIIGQKIMHEIGGGITNNDLYIKDIDSYRVMRSKIYTLLETRDLWHKHDLDLKKQADYLSAYFKETNQANKDLITVAELEALTEEGIKKGKDLIEEQQLVVNAALAKANIWNHHVDGEDVVVAVGICPNDLSSMFGATHNESTELDSLAIGVYMDGDSVAGLSLRSDGFYPYARIVAESLGGGGHDHASGVSNNSKVVRTIEDVIEHTKKILTEI